MDQAKIQFEKFKMNTSYKEKYKMLGLRFCVIIGILVIQSVMSDFLSWDSDIDLDSLLGEYTEYDHDHFDSDVSDYQCETKTQQASAKCLYKCPVCAKTLKTIAGFRGHTSKQHGKTLRACDHKISSNTEPEQPKSTFAFNVQDNFAEIFMPALGNTLNNIENDPFVSDPIKIKSLCDYVRSSQQISSLLMQIFGDIFSVPNCNITVGTDREQLFRRLHKVRVDSTVTTQISSLFPSPLVSATSLFYIQLIFEDLVGELLQQQTKSV